MNLPSRVSSGLFQSRKGARWALGGSRWVLENYKNALIYKYQEGVLEAAPQLVLQMYIILQNHGVCLKDWQGRQMESEE